MSFLLRKKLIHFQSITKWQGYEFYSAKVKCQGLILFMNYRMLLSYYVSVCVWTKKGWELKVSPTKHSGVPGGKGSSRREKLYTPHPATRTGIEGNYSKQGLDTRLLSLCMRGTGEDAAQQIKSSPLTCSAFSNTSNIWNFWWLKKMENIIFQGYFHSKEKG